jgi:hypothetical protein
VPLSSENVFNGQSLHAVMLLCAVAFEYVPASHKVQFAGPVLFLNVPIRHAEHAPREPVYPRLQMHPTKLIVPIADDEFSGQETHSDRPDTSAYLPLSHETQADEPLIFLYEPKGHWEHLV